MTEALELHLSSGRIHLERTGHPADPAVICIHGLSANLRAFDAIVPSLVSQGLQTIAIDLRGRGRSEVTPSGTYGLETHARDIVAVAEMMDIESVDIIGWSLGALIGITLAQCAPSVLRRLVLIDHAAAADQRAVSSIRSGLARLDSVVDDPATYVGAMRRALPITTWDGFWDRYFRYELSRRKDGRWSASTDRAACEEDMLKLRSPDRVRSRWSALRMPTLLVRCTAALGDGLIVPQDELNALIAVAPSVRVVELDCNHYEVMCDTRAARAIVDHLGTRSDCSTSPSVSAPG